MKTPNILIIGNSESGKSTAARILAQYFSTGWTGTSEIIVDALMRRWADAHVYQQQLNDLTRLKFHKQFGDLFRIFLRDVGNRLRENDPAALAKACLERGPIVEGVRTIEEYEACRELFDLIIWIEAPDTAPNATDGLCYAHAHRVVMNNKDDAFRPSLIAALDTWMKNHDRA